MAIHVWTWSEPPATMSWLPMIPLTGDWRGPGRDVSSFQEFVAGSYSVMFAIGTDVLVIPEITRMQLFLVRTFAVTCPRG